MGLCSSSEENAFVVAKKGGKHGHGHKDDLRESGSEEFETGRESLMDAEHDGHLEDVELTALRKIQKSVRRNRALGKAMTDNHWKFFSQVDTLEENETMHMATFLQNLIQLVPASKQCSAQTPYDQ